MKHPITTPRVASREAYSSLTQLNAYVFVDGNDLGASIIETDSLDYLSEDWDRSIQYLTKYCENFGYIQEAYVFDDDWDPVKRSLWSSCHKGFTTIDVEKETTSDTRVARVLSLRAFQTAIRLSGNAIFVFIVGGSNYQELIEEVRRKGFKTVLIGIDEYLTDDVKQSVDLWIPIQQTIPNMRVKKSSDDIENYDWTMFINLIDSMENSSLDFVGVKHLIRNVLPSIGLSDLVEAHIVIEQAEIKGIIEMYKVDNPNGTYPVKACRLLKNHDVVKNVLRNSNSSSNDSHDEEKVL